MKKILLYAKRVLLIAITALIVAGILKLGFIVSLGVFTSVLLSTGVLAYEYARNIIIQKQYEAKIAHYELKNLPRQSPQGGK